MVPVYVRGGAWSNAEDEVLKAAVSKYGLNQWARVSTLLPKKTAKQCRARWQEYLDPRIRKSDWSPEEDEQLLNLARLTPNQWRSIASTLGRTATQCVERYQKLLDEAAGGSAEGSSDLGLTGLVGGETMKAIGASTKDEVGDLNLNAEHREAIPDSVDMDDDEREMLSEARARLANTKGKKATRKIREKMLEESKRIALLQKRRELKQAGITTKLKAPKKKYAGQLDYNDGIPFEHKPTEGFYDTTEEAFSNEQKQKAFERQVERFGVKDDKPKEKRQRDKSQKTETTIEKEAKPVEDQLFKKRKLELPEPQFKESELDQLAKKGDVEAIETLKQKAITQGKSIDERITDAAQRVREEKQVQSALLITEEDVDLDDFETTKDREESAEVVVTEKKDIKTSIRERLAALPKPKNDFEIADEDELEQADEEDEQETEPTSRSETIPEDKGELERLHRLKVEEERKAALLRRSQAIQKGLTVPQPVDGISSALSAKDQVAALVNEEMVKLIRSDYAKLNNISGQPLLADLDDESRSLFNAEVSRESNEGEMKAFQAEFVKTHETTYKPRLDTSTLITELQTLVERTNKLEKTATKQFKGYLTRHESLTSESVQLINELKDLDRVLTAMEMLRDSEKVCVQTRADTLREEVDVLVRAEQRAQEHYLELTRTR